MKQITNYHFVHYVSIIFENRYERLNKTVKTQYDKTLMKIHRMNLPLPISPLNSINRVPAMDKIEHKKGLIDIMTVYPEEAKNR